MRNCHKNLLGCNSRKIKIMKCLKRKNYLEHTAVEEGHNGGFEKGYKDENVEFFPKCSYCWSFRRQLKRTGRIGEDKVTVVNIPKKKADIRFSFLLILDTDHTDKIILYHLCSTEDITIQLSPINLQAHYLDNFFFYLLNFKFWVNILLTDRWKQHYFITEH